MLESNIETKPRPLRFQSSNVDCDVIITLDPNSRDSVLDELSRRNELKGPVHLIHVPIQDQLVRVKEDSHHVAVLAMMVFGLPFSCFTRYLLFFTVLAFLCLFRKTFVASLK